MSSSKKKAPWGDGDPWEWAGKQHERMSEEERNRRFSELLSGMSPEGAEALGAVVVKDRLALLSDS